MVRGVFFPRRESEILIKLLSVRGKKKGKIPLLFCSSRIRPFHRHGRRECKTKPSTLHPFQDSTSTSTSTCILILIVGKEGSKAQSNAGSDLSPPLPGDARKSGGAFSFDFSVSVFRIEIARDYIISRSRPLQSIQKRYRITILY